MTKLNRYLLIVVLCFFVMLQIACEQKAKEDENAKIAMEQSGPFPSSDPENKGGWVLNEEISDEFEGVKLDSSKWFIEGQNGDYYIWKGRPPSQFVPHNVNLKNGKLVITSQWEPDYEFADEKYADGKLNEAYGMLEGEPLPVTTGGIITKKRFLYGYMEVEAQVGYAAISGAFWGIGYEQELDIFELMGNPKKYGFIESGEHFIGTVHDWSPPAERPTQVFLHSEKLDFNTSSGFHVYGAEWGKDYLSFYIDGKHIKTFTQDEVGTDFILNNPMEIWLDSEIFKRLGVPHEEELPVDFSVKYMRVWQKPTDNLLAKDAAFYGFEGPVLFEDNPRPLDLLPVTKEANDYQKFWIFDEDSAKYLQIYEGHYSTGVESLRFVGYGKNEYLEAEKVEVKSPDGVLGLPIGNFKLSMKVWLDQGRITDSIHVTLINPKTELVFSGLRKLPRKEWVVINKNFYRSEASSHDDGMIIRIKKENLPETKAAKFFIDDIEIRALTD
ncbi:family 16 glycosylhydrolase [Hyunsoonleella sp. SJ7]|uniref:Family 16 glycosylhydrolase n=1 Tax=Hyunsoonleella aquatilis TaxID=2762758 RepID=A0A923HIY9_9FLAO|nr:family 16 glycosylhydrolase [Hyunsoonleella aquatilis]MBC3759197.1 family 16 glycosylhydrolase [Hyunsoonleella aquatilis]